MAWFKKTPDQELIAQIKVKVDELRKLGEEADRRGITVWIKSGAGKTPGRAMHMWYSTAYRQTYEKL